MAPIARRETEIEAASPPTARRETEIEAASPPTARGPVDSARVTTTAACPSASIRGACPR
jgi:hypothetical protein